MDTYILKKPEIIVIHCTYGNEELRYNIDFFSSPYLKSRRDIIHGGRANVSIHFLVDRDGRIYSHLPLSYIGRHVIGFNYTSIGIENIGRNNSRLTEAQLKSNVLLVIYLKSIMPYIKYLIGHHEYDDKKRPHYTLIKCLDKSYMPYKKFDPGLSFIKKLRADLGKEGVTLLD